MNDEEKVLMERLSLDSEINAALLKHSARSIKLLASLIKTHAKVEWAHGEPLVRIQNESGKLVTVDEYTGQLRSDKEFAAVFHQEQTAAPTNASGVREIRKQDFQSALNNDPKLLKRVADGEVIVVDDEPSGPPDLEEGQIWARDQAAINANLEGIANGTVVVVR